MALVEYRYGGKQGNNFALETIEQLTGLNFGKLTHFDPLARRPVKIFTPAHRTDEIKPLKTYNDIRHIAGDAMHRPLYGTNTKLRYGTKLYSIKFSIVAPRATLEPEENHLHPKKTR